MLRLLETIKATAHRSADLRRFALDVVQRELGIECSCIEAQRSGQSMDSDDFVMLPNSGEYERHAIVDAPCLSINVNHKSDDRGYKSVSISFPYESPASRAIAHEIKSILENGMNDPVRQLND